MPLNPPPSSLCYTRRLDHHRLLSGNFSTCASPPPPSLPCPVVVCGILTPSHGRATATKRSRLVRLFRSLGRSASDEKRKSRLSLFRAPGGRQMAWSFHDRFWVVIAEGLYHTSLAPMLTKVGRRWCQETVLPMDARGYRQWSEGISTFVLHASR